MMQRTTKLLVIRRGLFAALILLAHILQNTNGLFFEFLGIRANLLIPLAVCIAMFEREVVGAFFGAFAGILWDTVTGLGDGYHALFLALIGAICGLLINLIMRNNLLTALILSGAACVLYALLYVVFFVLAQRVDSAGYLLFRYYLPSAIYSFIWTPIWYLIVRGIVRQTKI